MFKIFKYSFFDLVRSYWTLVYLLFYLAITTALLYMSGDHTKSIISMMNIILLLIPLVASVFGAIYYYNSREFIELLLSHPMKRSAIFLGQFLGLATSLSLSFMIGVGLPFVLWGILGSDHIGNFLVLMLVGLVLSFIFSLLSYSMALRFENRIKGFGFSLFAWLFLAVIYDGILLLVLIWFEAYPTEQLAIGLSLLNPIDLGRVLIMLKLDISALMGYTGAVFLKFFGNWQGMVISGFSLLLWIALPLGYFLRLARKKDF